ncbi:hypothetical protein [Atlantibacter hermannii]|uniref:hypothetical protein n=1 Tax=Atlantibacter hermannii TaxID=565 RepID=UPI00289A8E8D|nr:hypothetical protein [Atlantibacter hermannii]
MNKFSVFALACFFLSGCNGQNSEAIDFGKQKIMESLRDPDSAIFKGVMFSPDNENSKSKLSGYICGNVNAKNGFGGYQGDTLFYIYVESTPYGFDHGEPALLSNSDIESLNRYRKYCNNN